MRICLDASHGYNTPGKESCPFLGHPIKERVFNELIVNELKDQLKGHIVYTVSGSMFEDRPLSERVKESNMLNADIYVSIHSNATSEPTTIAYGSETFYYPNSKKGKLLASCIQKELSMISRDRGIKEGDFYVLNNTKCPAALVEMFFMNNPKELSLFMLNYRDYAYRIAKGILEYGAS